MIQLSSKRDSFLTQKTLPSDGNMWLCLHHSVFKDFSPIFSVCYWITYFPWKKKTSKVLIKSEFDLNWFRSRSCCPFLQVYLLIVCNWSVKNQSCLKKHTVQKRFNIHSSTLFLPQEHKNVLFWHFSSLNMMKLQRDPPIAGQINTSQLNLCARACALRSSQYEECSAEVAREVNKLLWYNSDIYRSDLPVRSGDGLIKVSASVTVYVGT